MKYKKPRRRRKQTVAQFVNSKLHMAIFKYWKYLVTKIWVGYAYDQKKIYPAGLACRPVANIYALVRQYCDKSFLFYRKYNNTKDY